MPCSNGLCWTTSSLLVTDYVEVLFKPPLPDLSSVAPCTDKEADSHMLLHVAHAARNGHEKIMIQTVDTGGMLLTLTVTLVSV